MSTLLRTPRERLRFEAFNAAMAAKAGAVPAPQMISLMILALEARLDAPQLADAVAAFARDVAGDARAASDALMQAVSVDIAPPPLIHDWQERADLR